MKNLFKGIKPKHIFYAMVLEITLIVFGWIVIENLPELDTKTKVILIVSVVFITLFSIPIAIIIKRFDKYL